MTRSSDWESDAPTRSLPDPDAPTIASRDLSSPTAAAYTLNPGQQFGPFAIVRPLGAGGMGEVYEAEELESGRHVALKVLSRSSALAADHARFRREGRLAAGISHPHTIYVYGTDEIQGVPVIAMELAPGGTLKELVTQRGALPPAHAVDIILQIAAGLEAAADVGVLHRDVKPSNCFVDTDGTVKVGDFGLSISTVTDERSLTMLGTVIGTPAFASPEQLRGDDLDVRSDIYSVGGTLYFLLTGRAPFGDTNVIRLVTQVAQDLPATPRSIRPEIPKELSEIVMRCLAKRPAERYATYDELRAALEPFSSDAPRPANPGIRFLAGVVDNLILWLLAIPVLTWIGDPMSPGQREGLIPTTLVTWLVDLVYYGIPEGLWGRAVGKQLFGLRVIDAARQRPGIPRATLRAVIWVLGVGAPMLAYGYAVAPLAEASRNTPLGALFGFSFPAMAMTLMGMMFVTARAANGYAGLHDLATGMRVVMKNPREGRVQSAPRIAEEPAALGAARTGPYFMLDEPSRDSADVLVGYDDRLRRKVWIRPVHPGEPHVPVERRTLSRATRLRWLSGRRTEGDAWDAFEAVDGRPLLSVLAESSQSWSAVRIWLLDLASEIRAGLADRSLPPLSLDRVWVTAAGRARLLDWPVGRAIGGEPAGATDLRAAQSFLYEIAARALDPLKRNETARIEVPLPLAARSFLERLERGAFDSTDRIVADATTIAREPAAIGRRRRLGHLAFCSLLPALAAVFMTILMMLFTRPPADPGVVDLTEALQRLSQLRRNPEDARHGGEQRAYELYVAARHRARVEDQATWSRGSMFLRFSPQLKAEARRAIAEHPQPAPADVAAAETIVLPFLAEERKELAVMRSPRGILSLVLLFGCGAFAIVGGFGLLSAVIFRGGLELRLFGAAVVTNRGHDAGRLRALWRALIAWSPAILGVIGLVMADERLLDGRVWMIPCLASLGLLFAGAIYAVRNPHRGLQDRLAGTVLVPR